MRESSGHRDSSYLARPGLGRDSVKKNTPKLKTPETEASGVSILITHSTAVVVPPATPSGRLSSSRWLSRPLAAPAHNLRLASTACTPARPVANSPARIGVVSSARPAANLRLSPAVPRFRPTFGDHSTRVELSSYGKADDQLPTRIGCRPLARLAAQSRLSPAVAPASPAGYASDLRRLFHPPAFAVRDSLRLRFATPSTAEPLMHSLLQSNLASPDKPSMSIRFSAGPCTLRNPPANNFRLASAFIPWCVQRSLRGSHRGFHPLFGLTAIAPALAGCSLRQPCWRSAFGLRRLRCLPASGNQLRCPTGSSVE